MRPGDEKSEEPGIRAGLYLGASGANDDRLTNCKPARPGKLLGTGKVTQKMVGSMRVILHRIALLPAEDSVL